MLVREASRGLIWNVAFTPVIAAITLAGSLIVVAHLSVELYGVYAIAGALALTIFTYGDLGLSAGLSRFLPELVERQGREGAVQLLLAVFLLRTVIVAVLVAGLLLAPSVWVRLFRLAADQRFLLGYVAGIVALETFASTGLYVLTARFRLPLVNGVLAAHAVAQSGLLIIASLAQRGLSGVLGALVLASVLKFGLSLSLAVREIARLPVRQDPAREPWFLRFIKVSLAAYVEKLSSVVHSPPFIILLLAATMTKVQVAVFALAGEFVVRALSLVLSPTNGLIVPTFAVAFLRGEDSKRRAFSYTIRLLTLLALPALVVLLVLAPDLMRVMYSQRYGAVVPVVRILLLSYFLEYTIYAPANAALLAGENMRAYLGVKVLSLLSAAFYLLAVGAVRLEWIALLMGAIRVATALLLLAVALNIHHLRYPVRALRTFAAAGLTGLMLWLQHALWPLPPAIQIPAGVVMGGLGMVGWLRALGNFDEEDRRLVRSTGLPLSHVVARIM